MRHSGLPLATSGSRANNTPCQARCAQNADHLAHNSPFSPFFTEVVCTLGTTPARTATSPPPNARNFATRGSNTSATRAIHHKTARTCSETLAHGASLHPGYRTCHVAGFVPCMPWYVLLVRTWACYSESGQPRPRTEQRVNVRNRRPTCETAGSHAGHVGTQVTVAHSQSITDHGAATHRPAMQHSQERGKHHHLQQQLSHATKPKSHPASNTICPSSKLAHTTYNTNFPHQQPKSHHKTNTFCPVTQKPHQHQCGGCRRARLRCPWAAAGPGRTTSRRAERSSRRGRRAGGPPPTGTPSSPAAIAAGCKAQPGHPQPRAPAARDTQTHRTLARALSPGLVHRRKRPPL